MKSKVIFAFWAMGAIPCALRGGDDAMAGKWKLNQAKSHFTGTTDSITAAGPDTWKFAYGSFSWTVKADGTDQPTPFNTTMSVTAEKPDVWKIVNKNAGKITITDTWTLTGGGKTMTRVASGTRENGEKFAQTTNMKRVGGGQGFQGTWESEKVQISSPEEVQIEVAEDGALTLSVPSGDVHFTIRFDGKEYPVTGARVPKGSTISGSRVSAREAHVIERINGKEVDTQEWKVSPDGKTTTITEHDPGIAKPILAVYDRI